MPDQRITIICPHCQKPVSIDDALTHQLQSKFRQDFDLQLKQEKTKLWVIAQEKAREKIEAQQDVETKLLKEENEDLKRKTASAEQKELEMRREKNKLETEKRSFELEKQRQLDSERGKIKQDVIKILSEEHQFKDAENKKIINDLRHALEDAQRKASQTSQQLQGEVLELELEELLKREFPLDTIVPVAKGVQGADIIQNVLDRTGKHCGAITWESKRTKAWSDGWVQKLKDDQRKAKAEIAILVTKVLPTGIKNFGPKDGVYVTNYDCILGVANVLRSAVIQVANTKHTLAGKSEKKEVLWNYLTSTEFKQRIEAILEAFSNMKQDLERERQVYTKLWAKREKQIQQVLDNTIGLRGELEGVIGKELPEIKNLELLDQDDTVDLLNE